MTVCTLLAWICGGLVIAATIVVISALVLASRIDQRQEQTERSSYED